MFARCVKAYRSRTQVKSHNSSMTEPLISVVIPNWNSGSLLRRCLASLQSQVTDHPYEIIVVDDGSTDGSADHVADFQSARLIRQPRSGASVARNRGVLEAQGSLILFLDADCAAEPDWIDEIASPLDRKEARVTVGRFVSRQSGLVPRLIQYELEGRFKRMKRYEQNDFLNSATCGFVPEIIRSHAFDPGFDKLEDLDLSFRLARSGIAIRYVPSAIVEHHHPTSFWAYLRRKFQYGRKTPRLYRLFPEKSLRDGSTPVYRRYQLFLLTFGLMALPLSLALGTILIGFSLALTFPTAAKVLHESAVLAALYPVFSGAGSVAFLTGTLVGALSLPFQPHKPPQETTDDRLDEKR